MDTSRLLDRLHGDVALLREITTVFLDEYPVLLSQIRDAVRTGNSRLLESSAHSLKGSVAYFDEGEAVQAAFELEKIGRHHRIQESSAALSRLEDQLANLAPALQMFVTDHHDTLSRSAV